MMTRPRAGFTLIELLVSIAILGLLISILLPALGSARRQAKAKVCLSSLKTLGNSASIYIDENGERLPPYKLNTPAPDSGPDAVYVNEYRRGRPRWPWFLDINEEPVIDPRGFSRDIDSNGWFDDESLGGHEIARAMTSLYFTCPMLTDDFAVDIRDGAYGYNYQYLGNTRADTNPTRWDNFAVASHRLRSPGQTVLMADSAGQTVPIDAAGRAGPAHGVHSYTLDPPRLAVERHAVRFGPSDDDVPDGLDERLHEFSPAEPRHNKRANVVFLDTHAEAMTLKQLGYHSNPAGVLEPILDPVTDTKTASNRMWTGSGTDPIAAEQHGADPP